MVGWDFQEGRVMWQRGRGGCDAGYCCEDGGERESNNPVKSLTKCLSQLQVYLGRAVTCA